MNKQEINAVLNKHGLTVESIFVPWSQSRNAGEKSPSLNWRVTLKHNGRNVISTDYSAGCGHCPSYQQRATTDSQRAVLNECERGKVYKFSNRKYPARHGYWEEINPDPADVIYSLLMDSEAINYIFEEWAGNFGYSEDSREAERLYNECLKIGIQMRKIGESTLTELREAFQDY